jgi:hypothetical protein
MRLATEEGFAPIRRCLRWYACAVSKVARRDPTPRTGRCATCATHRRVSDVTRTSTDMHAWRAAAT